MRIKENPDKGVVKEIRKQLKENDGYCPCKVERNASTKCICQEFREQEMPGYCHCGLYYKG